MLLFLFEFLLFSLSSAETVYEHRNRYLDSLKGNQLDFHSEKDNLTIHLFPQDRVTFTKDVSDEIQAVFNLYTGNEYDDLVFGKNSTFNNDQIYGNYGHTEIYVTNSFASFHMLVLRATYECCKMLSREHYLQALQSPFEDVNYIYQFSSIPTFRKVVMTLDLKICSIHFCDHFSQSSLSSYTPRSSYRFSVPFLEVSEAERLSISEEVRNLFLFGYNHYLKDAYPAPQLNPLTCGPARFAQADIPFMTLIDVLDTLHVLDYDDAFVEAVQVLNSLANFDFDENVSVFETTIRVLGGLVSAHMLLIDNSTILQSYNKRHHLQGKDTVSYNGHLLNLAIDMGNRLLCAFQDNGLAYGTVNLRYGVPANETPISSLAGIGSSLLEFAALSALTNNMTYLDTSRRCTELLFSLRNPLDMLGKHIDIQKEQWTEYDSCFGRNGDSYYEYLLKGYILLNDPQLLDMFTTLYTSFEVYSRSHTVFWYGINDLKDPSQLRDGSYSLSAFWPGIQFLYGDYIGGKATLMRFLYAWDHFGYLPEYFSVMNQRPIRGGEDYPLRPELIESMMYHDTVFGNGEMIHWGKMIFEQLKNTMTKCGFASIKNIYTGELIGEMPSFVLSETFKYLYLLYNNHSQFRGREYLFTTEGHVLNISHIQRNSRIQSYIREVNALYEENESWLWDLRCSAEYDSDYFSILRHNFPSLKFSSVCSRCQDYPAPCHKPFVVNQCPAVDDRLVLSSWFLYEDFVYYSYDNTTWNQLWYPQKGGFPLKKTKKRTESQVVSVTLDGKNSFEIRADSLDKLIALLTEAGKPITDGSPEERMARRQAKKEIRKILGLKPSLPDIHSDISAETTWSKNHMFSPSLSVNVTCQVNDHCTFNDTLSLLSLTPISPAHIIIASTVFSTNDTHMIMVDRMDDGQAVRYECVMKLQISDLIQFIPCVITNSLSQYNTTIDTVLVEGLVSSVSNTELVLNKRKGSMSIPIQSIYTQSDAPIVAIDSSHRIMKLSNMAHAIQKSLHVSVIVKFLQSQVPFIEWKNDSMLYRDDIYSIALLHSSVQRHGVFIGKESDYDDLVLYIEDVETANVI